MNEQTTTRAAIVYDFDGTLSPGSMQQHSYLPEIGYADPSQFWEEVKEETKQQDGDEILVYMQMMVRKSREPVTRQRLRSHGSALPLFDGVISWFDRMNTFAGERRISLEHYVVSSGLREMIEGCSIREQFAAIFASGFAYDHDGWAIWPSVAVNYTNKTQFLFRINKGISNTWDNVAINRWVPMSERAVPFERMIFIGDGDTDIPSMKMVRFQGGCAIAVFDPGEWPKQATQNKIGRLIAENRANYVAPADYPEGGQLDVTVRGVLGRIAREAGYRPNAGETS
ncbi:HAD family hydrolase [Nitratireductor indicus]|uniref:HAD family hydrolase n=1 Tax=Nitratireductor indicus TaxID=721133 RepID=UPI002874FD0F|nr:HAD family hydrolase [Nitratireductor indicus]MDS1136723.1 HAD family hydrolase [Nitratireductor indicus]